MWRMAVEDKSRRSVISTLQSRTPPLSSRIQEAGIKDALQEGSIFGDLLIDHQMRSNIVEIHSSIHLKFPVKLPFCIFKSHL